MSSRSSLKIQQLQNGAGLFFAEKENKSNTVKDKRPSSIYFCAHTGTSMNPTLYELDLLEIEPYGKYSVQIGDVILFVPPQGECPAVHRVVQVSLGGIRTRGDNNSRMDSWIIDPEDVLGKVVRAARGRRRRSIYGGRLGWLWSIGIRAFKVLMESASLFYHLLAQWGLLRRCVPLQKRMRIIAVNHARGKELKLILGRWVVGWRKPEGLQWQIRRPFRLFVDERSLPQ
jgi:signal peptidase